MKKLAAKVTARVTLDVKDVFALWNLSRLPEWIQTEFVQRYVECNADRLPVDACRRLLEKLLNQGKPLSNADHKAIEEKFVAQRLYGAPAGEKT